MPILGGFRSTVVSCNSQKRSLFYWLTIVFNRVDRDRVKKYGSDRVCAEWLLRNGAYVRWKGSREAITDYNLLDGSPSRCYIEGVIAINAGINYVGFDHFDGCKHIKDIKIEQCRYIDDKALPLLSYLKDSLTTLHLSKCNSITEDGLCSLTNLKNLNSLTLESLTSVTDEAKVEKVLKTALPNCNIQFV